MIRRFGLLAALAAISFAVPAMASANAEPGDHAKNSAVYAEFIANCKAGLNDPPNLRDEAAARLEKMSKAERELQVKGCQMSLPPEAKEQVKVASSVPPAAYLGPVARTFQKMAMKRHRPQQRHAAPVAEDNYAEVREFLRTYKGPLWKTHGPDHRHMNEPPPADAVPCRPPGSDHVMLCAPRRHP